MQKSRFSDYRGCFWMVGLLDDWMELSQLLRNNHLSLFTILCYLFSEYGVLLVAPKLSEAQTESDFLFLVSSFLFNQNFNKAPNSFNVFHLGIIVAVNCRNVNKTNFNFASCRFN